MDLLAWTGLYHRCLHTTKSCFSDKFNVPRVKFKNFIDIVLLKCISRKNNLNNLLCISVKTRVSEISRNARFGFKKCFDNEHFPFASTGQLFMQ